MPSFDQDPLAPVYEHHEVDWPARVGLALLLTGALAYVLLRWWTTATINIPYLLVGWSDLSPYLLGSFAGGLFLKLSLRRRPWRHLGTGKGILRLMMGAGLCLSVVIVGYSTWQLQRQIGLEALRRQAAQRTQPGADAALPLWAEGLRRENERISAELKASIEALQVQSLFEGVKRYESIERARTAEARAKEAAGLMRQGAADYQRLRLTAEESLRNLAAPAAPLARQIEAWEREWIPYFEQMVRFLEAMAATYEAGAAQMQVAVQLMEVGQFRLIEGQIIIEDEAGLARFNQLGAELDRRMQIQVDLVPKDPADQAK